MKGCSVITSHSGDDEYEYSRKRYIMMPTRQNRRCVECGREIKDEEVFFITAIWKVEEEESAPTYYTTCADCEKVSDIMTDGRMMESLWEDIEDEIYNEGSFIVPFEKMTELTEKGRNRLFETIERVWENEMTYVCGTNTTGRIANQEDVTFSVHVVDMKINMEELIRKYSTTEEGEIAQSAANTLEKYGRTEFCINDEDKKDRTFWIFKE